MSDVCLFQERIQDFGMGFGRGPPVWLKGKLLVMGLGRPKKFPEAGSLLQIMLQCTGRFVWIQRSLLGSSSVLQQNTLDFKNLHKANKIHSCYELLMLIFNTLISWFICAHFHCNRFCCRKKNSWKQVSW